MKTQKVLADHLNKVAKYYDVPIYEIKGKSRKPEHKTPRQVFLASARAKFGFSFPAIGLAVMKTDSSAQWAVGVINDCGFCKDKKSRDIYAAFERFAK